MADTSYSVSPAGEKFPIPSETDYQAKKDELLKAYQ